MNRSLSRGLAATALAAAVSLALGGGDSRAQTAAPPPRVESVISLEPGTDVIAPEFVAVAPAGIPALTHEGALAVVPTAAEGVVSAVSATLGGGVQATALVPASPTVPLAVRLEALELTDQQLVISIDVYDSSTGQALDSPVTLGVRPPPGVDPMSFTVLQYDRSTGASRVLQGTFNPETGALEIAIP